jgi:hypothetical protein
MSRSYGLLLVFVLALATLPVAAAPILRAGATIPPAPALDPEFMGMAIRDPWYEFNTNPDFPNAPNEAFQEEMGATLERAGVRWVRIEFHIPAAIDSPEAISAEIAKNDYFINEVAPRHNLKVLGLLGFDLLRNRNFRDLNCDKQECSVPSSHYGGGVNDYMDKWLTRALMIADHYRENIAAYEILNEENRLPQTGDAIAAPIMGRLLTKFYRFCKNVDPTDENHGCESAQIVLGGIHPRGTNDTQKTTDAQYLQAIYNDPGSFGAFHTAHAYYPVDGIGYHPYPEEIHLSPNDMYVDRGLQRMRAALTLDPCKQFWVTEVGYNVGFDPDGPRNPRPAQTEQGQAAFLQDVYTTLPPRQLDAQLCGGGPEVANVFWFKYEDFPPATGPSAQQWGIVRIPILDGNCEGGCYDSSGKPLFYRQAFWTYRELAGLPVYRTYLSTVGHP